MTSNGKQSMEDLKETRSLIVKLKLPLENNGNSNNSLSSSSLAKHSETIPATATTTTARDRKRPLSSSTSPIERKQPPPSSMKRAKSQTTEIWNLIDSLDSNIKRHTETAESTSSSSSSISNLKRLENKSYEDLLKMEEIATARREEEARRREQRDKEAELAAYDRLQRDRHIARQSRLEEHERMMKSNTHSRYEHAAMDEYEKLHFRNPLRYKRKEMFEFYSKRFPPSKSAVEIFNAYLNKCGINCSGASGSHNKSTTNQLKKETDVEPAEPVEDENNS